MKKGGTPVKESFEPLRGGWNLNDLRAFVFHCCVYRKESVDFPLRAPKVDKID